jgi:hypothetical protein
LAKTAWLLFLQALAVVRYRAGMPPPTNFRFGAFPWRAAIAMACVLAGWAGWVDPAAAQAMAAEARVSVRPDREGLAVNTAVTRGFNFGNWMAVAEQREALARVPAASLRFPGGNIGDDQDMDAATLDTFAALLSLVAGRPELVVQTRVFAGRVDRKAANSPGDAAAAVRMARERGLKVAEWEIGNEPDLYATVRGDLSWTPERYCTVFRAQAAAIKATDPGARVAGPAVSGSAETAMPFLERFVELCGDAVDVLSWHLYPTGGEGSEDAALASITQVDASVEHLRRLWRDPARNPRGHQRKPRLAVTEYGLSWRTDRPRFLADQPAALWAAEAALRLAYHGVDAAHYFAYQGTGFHGLLDNAGVPRPTYYAFRMLGDLRGRFVGADSSHPRLWAHAVRDGDRVHVLLLNTTTEPLRVDVDSAGWQPEQAHYFDAAIADEELPLAPLAAQRRLTLPPRSMSLLLLTKDSR